MKDKILEEALEWYEKQEENPDIEDFVDLVIHKTTDSLFDKVKDELKNEFYNGNLKHSFVISSDYYLDLKFKEIRDKCIKSMESDFSSKVKTQLD